MHLEIQPNIMCYESVVAIIIHSAKITPSLPSKKDKKKSKDPSTNAIGNFKWKIKRHEMLSTTVEIITPIRISCHFSTPRVWASTSSPGRVVLSAVTVPSTALPFIP